MKVEDTQIYKDVRLSALWILDVADKFPRKYKFTIGDRIVMQSIELLDEVIAGCNEYRPQNKMSHFVEASRLMICIDTKILLSSAKQCLTNKELVEWMQITNKVKRQLSGITNSLARRSGISMDITE